MGFAKLCATVILNKNWFRGVEEVDQTNCTVREELLTGLNFLSRALWFKSLSTFVYIVIVENSRRKVVFWLQTPCMLKGENRFYHYFKCFKLCRQTSFWKKSSINNWIGSLSQKAFQAIKPAIVDIPLEATRMFGDRVTLSSDVWRKWKEPSSDALFPFLTTDIDVDINVSG